MAWRDSRKNRSKLLLFISSIVLGIAALVAVFAFRDNLQRDIDEQAKTLTGADLVLESRKTFDPAIQKLFNRLGDERAEEKTFPSMVYFVKNGANRLAQIKALKGAYPYYGEIETKPLGAAAHFQQNRNALVDETFLLQFGAKVGDSVKIGELSFKITGAIIKAPGQTNFGATLAPIVYIPLTYLEATKLIKVGSQVMHKFYYRYQNPNKINDWIKQNEKLLDREGIEATTIERKKEQTGSAFKDVNRFLALSGFIALLLGCVGIGSAIHVYIQEKLNAVATLRCLGLKAKHAFFIYLIQVFFIGLLAAFIGVSLGTGIQFLIPWVLKDFLPVSISLHISWVAVGQGLVLGLVISVLFALPSLLSVRKISPLNALRASFETKTGKADVLIALVYVLMALFVMGFTRLQMQNWFQALAFSVGIGLAFLSLIFLAKLLLFLVKRFLPAQAIYVWRQGFANLYRPNNQTLMLTVSIGLSTAFIATLYFVQIILLDRVKISSGSNQPNMVMFDIQSSQKKSLDSLTQSYALPLMNQVSVITMRIDEINGQRANKNTKNKRAFTSEIRATYQAKLTDAEKITAGKWIATAEKDKMPLISLEQRFAEQLGVKIGDKITFNVQGVLIETQVASFREVNWTRFQTNFRVVFPTGVLEDAPQFQVLMTRVPSPTLSAKFQSEVVKKFPNVSVIDLDAVLKLLDELLGKIAFVIQFMAGFSMVTGWIVLLSSVLTSKNQRLKESILLRTLGADKKQILKITGIEYFFLGAFAAAAGMILALIGGWALAKFSFDATFIPPLIPTLLLFFSVVSLVMFTGLISSRGLLSQPPLKILRNEN